MPACRCFEKAMGRVATLTLREFVAICMILCVVLATMAMQAMEYARILPEQREIYKTNRKLDGECQDMKRDMPTAYERIADDCYKAKLVIQVLPKWSALSQLVNTTWPHAPNIGGWFSNLFSILFDSYSGYVTGIAMGIYFWPILKQSLGLVGNVVNTAKKDKVDIELNKMMRAQLLSNMMPHALRAPQQSLLDDKRKDAAA
jgi:hypothetical protein